MTNSGPVLTSKNEVRIYKRKQESKKKRKHAFDQESDQEKKERKHALDQESDQEKSKHFFFLIVFLVDSVFSFSFFLLSCSLP